MTLPTQPGERFEWQAVGNDKLVLTRLVTVKARPSSVKLRKNEGVIVGKLDRPISEAALREALAEFP